MVLAPIDGTGLDAALSSEADAILLSVADASEPAATLRERASEALPRIASAGKRALAIVNHPAHPPAPR
jgi:hypothetical protein